MYLFSKGGSYIDASWKHEFEVVRHWSVMPDAKVSLKVIQSADQEGALEMDAPEIYLSSLAVLNEHHLATSIATTVCQSGLDCKCIPHSRPHNATVKGGL